ncbi:MAG: hypothetical protein CMI58_05620 [Parcubacteria group bacterium]|nr:hypothetical protein [Parcubacteria group bacterium]|tara:strand:+ start:179 stop:373 length:195 start_codon:yes stop_codon:yes gene_type:complete
MRTNVDLEVLNRVHQELKSLETKCPCMYNEFAQFIRKNRDAGYRNICRMWIGEATPEKLKESAE